MVFDTTFNNVTGTTFAGKFVDPNPVAGFTPYNIQRLSDGNIYVTYAAATSTGAPLPGGYVDEYDTAGNFIRRIATNGPINAAWGLAIAPSNFGTFSGDLLIGNLYNSKINAYNLGSTPQFAPQFEGSSPSTRASHHRSGCGPWRLATAQRATRTPSTSLRVSMIKRTGSSAALASYPSPAPVYS